MMQFYKNRDFGSLISDTFNFFKHYGKNFFKNYFLINGILLIISTTLLIIGYREFFLLSAGSNEDGQVYYFQQYFQENEVMFITIGILIFILFYATMLISYSFPVLYLKRISETGNKNIKADEIMGDLKSHIPRIIKLFFGMLFIMIPIGLMLIGISSFLMVILIGFFLLLILFPFIINVNNFLMYDYLNTNKDFFQSLYYAFNAQFSYPDRNHKSPFWKYIGSTIVIYILIQVMVSIFTAIPTIIFMIFVFTKPNAESINEKSGLLSGSFGVFLIIIYGVALLISIIFMNLLNVNAGLMYYDSRTDLHRKEELIEIETIGKQDV